MYGGTRPRLRNTFFRAVSLRFHHDPLGRARPIHAQRFNAERGARVLYVGDNPNTCLYEVQAFGFPATSVVIVPIELALQAVIDLRDPAERLRLGILATDIQINFRSSPGRRTDMQELGEVLASSGRVDGLLYESVAKPGATCLAIFEAGVAALGSKVEVNDPQNGLAERL
jgi:RES domain-containing protein